MKKYILFAFLSFFLSLKSKAQKNCFEQKIISDFLLKHRSNKFSSKVYFREDSVFFTKQCFNKRKLLRTNSLKSLLIRPNIAQFLTKQVLEIDSTKRKIIIVVASEDFIKREKGELFFSYPEEISFNFYYTNNLIDKVTFDNSIGDEVIFFEKITQ